MIKILFNKSIKRHIIVYFSTLFFLSIMLFGVITYNIFSNILTNELLTYTTKIVDEARINLDSYFSQIETLIQITASDSSLIKAVRDYKNNDYSEKLHNDRVIGDFLQGMMKINPKIKDIMIVNSEGYVYNYTGRAVRQDYCFYEQDWFPCNSNKVFKAEYIGLHPQDYYLIPNENDEDIISAVIPVADFMDPNRDFYATVIFNLKVREVEEINKQITLERTGFFSIIDNYGQIICKPRNHSILKSSEKISLKNIAGDNGSFWLKENDKDMMIVYRTSKVTNWKFVAMIPRGEILKHLNGIKNFTFVLTLVCILVVLIISFIVSSRITNPITRLMKRMGKIEQGDFSVKLFDDSTEEIEMLSSRMDLMIERINSLNKDIYLYQIKNRDAVIKALQTQINPHFLYNTLQAIKALAVCGKNSDISRMVTLLGNMLRYAVYNSEELVTIKEEIKHVREYLEIQSFRYPGQFEYLIECPVDLEGFKTLKLILQPIVENSVQHGLNESIKGLISIVIEKSHMGIRILISDNGKGITEAELNRIIGHNNDHEQKDDSHSIGLKNVYERIRLRFGDPYGIEITSKENVGTSVRIQIPEII